MIREELRSRDFLMLSDDEQIKRFINNDDYFNKNLRVKGDSLIISSRFRKDLLEVMLKVADKYVEEKRVEISNVSSTVFIDIMHSEFTRFAMSSRHSLGNIGKTIKKLKSTKGFKVDEMNEIFWWLEEVKDKHSLHIEFNS